MTEGVADTPALERRLRAVTAVGEVVGAIWALAKAQLAQIETGSAEANVYLSWIDDTVDRLLGPPRPGVEGDTLTVVFGPERPFCGSLPREAARVLSGIRGSVGVVGTRFAQAVHADGPLGARCVFSIPGVSSLDELDTGAERVGTVLLAHGGSAHVDLLYPDLRGDMYRAVLLPRARLPPARVPDTFSPPAKIIAAALRGSIQARLVVALAQSLAAEVRARMATADKARDAIARRRDALEQAFQVLRQEQITTELNELHAARAASEPEP